jgi:hypothetical protein
LKLLGSLVKAAPADAGGLSDANRRIYVYKWDALAQVAGDLETLTDDSAAPLANPVISDDDGIYYFNSPDGQKLLELHYGGKVQVREVVPVGPLTVDLTIRSDLAANVTTAQINVLSSVTSTLFVRPSINVSDGTLLKSATPDFLTAKPLEIIASTILIEPTSKIAINPTPNSLAQAIVVNQTSPLSGTVADQFAFTEFNVIIRSARTPGGIPGNPGSGTWKGLCVSVNAGGANFGGDSVMGGAFGVVQDVADTSTADKNGLASGVQISASTLGKAYGASSGATVTSTGACAALYGYETDVIVGSASVPHAVGFNAWSGGTLQGSSTYAAFTLGISGTVGTAKWKTGMRLYTQGGATGSPVDSGFSWFDSDHTTTVGNVFNCSNVTVTGDILYFPNVRLTGAGVLGLNTATSSIGIGNAAPTDAWLKIAASTTTKPHLRLVVGVAPTSPTNGDFWSDGTNLKWVNGSGVTKTVTVT